MNTWQNLYHTYWNIANTAPFFNPTVKYKGSWAMCLQSIEHASHATVWETCDVYDKIAFCKHIQWMLRINYASADGHAESVN